MRTSSLHTTPRATRPQLLSSTVPSRSMSQMPARTVAPARPAISGRQAALRWILEILAGLVRRPLLTVTIVAAVALLTASIGEARAAARLQDQVARTQAQNTALQGEIRHIDDEIARDSTPAAIIAHARRLGYVPAASSPTP